MSPIGIIIPTRAERDSLKLALASALSCQEVKRVIVVTNNTYFEWMTENGTPDPRLVIVQQKNSGLAQAINLGLTELDDNWTWNWLGDDDLLVPEGLETLYRRISQRQGALWGIGAGTVRFASSGYQLRVKQNNFGLWMQSYGPNLMIQPAMLFSVKATKNSGGICEDFRFAFDQELIQRFFEMSKPVIEKKVCAIYNWHNDTLTSQNRRQSQLESLKIREVYSKSFKKRTWNRLTFPFSTSTIWILHLMVNVLVIFKNLLRHDIVNE